MMKNERPGPQQKDRADDGRRSTSQALPLTDRLIGATIVIPGGVGKLEHKYTIEGELSRGGMGTIYMAKDNRSGARVVLKLTPPLQADDLDGDATAQRLLREAYAMQIIDHPNVVKIYDCGQVAGRLCIVMEYVDGTPLSKRLDGGHIPWSEARSILLQACDGLAAAHNTEPNKIVHRDIKPANIMVKILTRDKLHITLIDFGAVKFLDSKTMQTLTRENALIGTFYYSSPEQLDSAKNLDYRSDIYSLGAVMYELLTGTRPFISTTVGALFKEIIDKTPVLPSVRCPGIPKKLDHIVMKALEKDPAKRFQSVEDFAKAVRKVRWNGKLLAQSNCFASLPPRVSPPMQPRSPPPMSALACPAPRSDDSEDVSVLYQSVDIGFQHKRHAARLAALAAATMLVAGAGAVIIPRLHAPRPPLTETINPAPKTIAQPNAPDSSMRDSLSPGKKQEPPVPVHKAASTHSVRHVKVLHTSARPASIQSKARVRQKS